MSQSRERLPRIVELGQKSENTKDAKNKTGFFIYVQNIKKTVALCRWQNANR